MDICPLCNVEFDHEHLTTDLHKFNYLINQWRNHRKSLVKNREGIIISATLETEFEPAINAIPNERKGKYCLTLTPREFESVQNKVVFNINVTNDRTKDIYYIMKATILVPFRHFTISDEHDMVNSDNPIELKPKDEYNYTVELSLEFPLRGSYKIPIAFTFQSADEKPDHFTIAREIVVIISDIGALPKETGGSPFKNQLWEDVMVTIPCVKCPKYPNEYPIPRVYMRILQTGLNDRFISPSETYLLNFAKNAICATHSETGKMEPQYPTASNYKDFYHFLLWLDEVGQRMMLQRYNMSNVTMTIVPGDMLELEVPGLAEKRPSLISGDIVKIRLSGDHTAYKGMVKTINDKTIWIHNMHEDLITMIEENENVEFDVAFSLSRLTYERMHKAVDACVQGGHLKLLFPSEELKFNRYPNRITIPYNRFYHPTILSNREQKEAVENILNCTSQSAPYIVFGPPGTGKTLTIVEAILQIRTYLPSSKILICAPANSACDMLTSKLIRFIQNPSQLIRIHSDNRNWDEVPADIKPFSNRDGKKYYKMTAEDVANYPIVITTLILIGKFCHSKIYKPDFIFIDEAAQAMEPEADVAIRFLRPGRQLILAGDPKQLGPSCSSSVAAKFKLDNSLLERLMTSNPLYGDGEDNRFITMLKLNYRAHPLVLQVPNELFYEGKLKPVNVFALNDPIARIFIHPLTIGAKGKLTAGFMGGLPVEFCAVHAKEQRHGKSPSYFNESELQMVVKYVEAILTLTCVSVQQTDIGIVTPYIRQVHRIKGRLRDRGYNHIEVGTTEVFQGREKRIVILSTVRAQHDLLLVDKQYKLGFVKSEKRMNVALTRAMSKLIIIGHPHVLGTCKNWKRFIEFCEERNAYFGAQNLQRTAQVRSDIVGRFSNVPLSREAPSTKRTRRRRHRN